MTVAASDDSAVLAGLAAIMQVCIDLYEGRISSAEAERRWRKCGVDNRHLNVLLDTYDPPKCARRPRC